MYFVDIKRDLITDSENKIALYSYINPIINLDVDSQTKILLTSIYIDLINKTISSIEDFNPEKERIEFREDIFNRIVDKGTVFPDGRIIYDLIFEIKWTSYGNEPQIWRLPIKDSK